MTEYRTPAEMRLERAQALQMKRLEPQIRRAQNEQVQEALKGYKQAKIDAEIERSKKNFIVRGVSTLGDVAGNIITGALKGIEGIVDFGLAVDGALNPLAYLFDYQDATKKFSEKDLVGTYIDAPMEDFLKYSYTKDGSFGQTVEDVASGIGQLVPAAVAAYFTGGTSLAASGASIAGMTVPQAVALGVTTTSAAGNATEQAYQEGAGRYEGLLYGTASGAMEAATEKLTGGIGMYGKGLLNGVVKSTAREGVEAVAKTGVRRVVQNAIGEAGEEVVAELANPALKSIYKGKDAFSEYGDAEYWKGVGHAGIVGGLTSIASEGTVGRVTKTAGAYADAQSVLEEISGIDTKVKNQRFAGTFTAERARAADASKLANLRVLENTLKNTNAKQRTEIIKRNGLSGLFDADGSLNAEYATALSTESQFNRSAYSESLRGNEKIIAEDLAKTNADLGLEGDAALTVFDGTLTAEEQSKYGKVQKVVEAFNKRSGTDTALILLNPNKNINGNITPDSGRIYLSADNLTDGTWAGTIVHEFTHFAEGTAEHDALVEILLSDEALTKQAWNKLSNKDYGFDMEAMADIHSRMKESGGNALKFSLDNEGKMRYAKKVQKISPRSLLSESDWERLLERIASMKFLKYSEPKTKNRNTVIDIDHKIVETNGDVYNPYVENVIILRLSSKKISKARDVIYEHLRQGRTFRESVRLTNEICQEEVALLNRSDYSEDDWEGDGYGQDSSYYGGYLRESEYGRGDYSDDEGATRQGIYRDGGRGEGIGGGRIKYSAKEGRNLSVDADEAVAYETFVSEMSAHLTEEMLGNEAFIDKIIRENGTLGEKILGKIIAFKEALGRIGDPEVQAQHKRLAEAEKLYLDAIEAAGKRYVNGKIVSANDDEEKENTAEGGGKYSLEDQENEGDYTDYDKPITLKDIEVLRSIGRKSINQFTPDEIKIAQKWAHKFYKELGVKSPFFRAWFGEWRAHSFEPLALPNIDLSVKLSSGNAINQDTGRKLSWSPEVKKEAILNASKGNKPELEIIADNLSSVVENSILLDSSVSIKKTNRKLPGTTFMHSFYALVPINDHITLVKLFAEEAISLKSGESFTRAYSLKHIEKVAEFDNGVLSPMGGLTESHSTTTYSISDLYEFVKQFDKEFSAAPEVSELVLNDDGTPKVFYHGTDADFNAFSYGTIGNASGVEILGEGFYFTDKEELAKKYGKNVKACYLRMSNPYIATESDLYNLNVEQLSAQNYDGVILKSPNGTVYMVFENTQVKSATDNIGTFDRRNPDLRYSLKDDRAGIEDWMRNGMGVDSQTSAKTSEAQQLKQTNRQLVKENRSLIKERDSAVEKKAKAEEKLQQEKIRRKEAEAFDQVKNRVLKAVRGITNWKKGEFESAAEANGDALKGVIGQLSRIENKGNISATGTRKAMKAISDWYARPDKHPIVKELQESQLYDEGVLDLMNEIGDDEKIEKNAKLSAAELANVEIVIRHFKHIVENYHRVFRDGKYVEAKPLVEKFIKIAEENAKIKTVFGTKVMEHQFYQYFGDVESIMKWNDRYNEEGFFTTTFRELREGSYRMAVAQMEMRQELDEWLDKKENKRFLDGINERTVEVRGLTMSAAEAMSLYMTTKREQAQGGILDAGFSVRDRKTGTLHSAEGLLRAAYAESGEVDLLAAQREMLNFRDELWKGFSDKERAYIQMAEKIFNGECKTRKARTDEVRLGYSNVSEDYYFPIRRGHLAQKVGEDTLGGEVQRIKSLSFNKNIVQGSKGKLYIEPINNVLDRHIAGIALYENISIPIDNFNRMFNMDVSGNKNDPRTIATVTSGDGGWADAKSYIDKLIKDIEGIRSEDKWASDTLKFIRSGFVRFQLGANPKTWATQLSSLFAATSMVDPKYMAKAMTMKANGADLDKYSPLAKLRNSENTAVIAQGVIDKVGRVGDALMVPIGKVDRYVVTRLWNACQLQVEAEQGLKLGTEENKVAAGKMLEKVIFETQQNSLLTERSAAMRSSNELIKGLTMFSADGMKITGRVLDAFGRISVIKERLKNAEGATKTKLEAELKGATKEFRRSSAAMVSTAVFMSVIAYAFSHLYGKRDEDETTGEAIATFLGDFVGNLLGGLPLIRDIYSYIVDGYELNNYALSSVNDLLSGASGLISLAGDIINGREVTSQQIATKTKAALFGVGQLFGIPLRNAYNVGRGVIGLSGLITGNGNSIGYAWDSLFYDKSYRSDLNKAMEKGDEKMVAMIADLMVNESLGTIDARSRDAIKSLIGEGYDVLPRSVGDSVTYDGEEYEFTARSRKRFEEVYGIADEAVKDLVSMSKFSSADAAVQAKAIRFIYDVYYNLALEDFLGVDIENKTVLFAQALDIEKLALIVATARSIEGDKDRNGKTINGSKKLKVVKYIESLRMTAAEKYMIMGYLGYKNVNGEAAVRSYINKLSLTKQEKTKLLSYSGYAA